MSNTLKVKINVLGNSLFNSNNLGMTIFVIILICINLSLGGFLFYYFIIRKFKKKKVL